MSIRLANKGSSKSSIRNHGFRGFGFGVYRGIRVLDGVLGGQGSGLAVGFWIQGVVLAYFWGFGAQF